jgi:hypothetical protein
MGCYANTFNQALDDNPVKTPVSCLENLAYACKLEATGGM